MSTGAYFQSIPYVIASSSSSSSRHHRHRPPYALMVPAAMPASRRWYDLSRTALMRMKPVESYSGETAGATCRR